MMRRTASAVVIAGACLLVLGACSDDSAPTRQEMIDQAVEETGMDEAEATCLVDGLLDEFGAERVEEMVGDNEDPDDMSEEEQAAIAEVVAACLDSAIAGDVGEDPGVTLDTTTTTPDAATTTAP